MEKINIENLANKYESVTDEQKLLAQVMADKEVWSQLLSIGVTMEIARNNLPVVIDFMHNFHECRGQGKTPLYQLSLIRVGNILQREYSLSPQEAKRQQRQQNVIFADYPEAWADLRLTGKPINYDVLANRGPLLGGLIKLISGDKHWLYVNGKPRKGKSFLCALAFNDLLERNMGRGAFIDTSRRFRELNDLFFVDRTAADNLFRSLAEVDYLILDGFGNEYISDFTRDTFMFPLLEERSRNNLVTIFTSNYALDELPMLYGQNSAVGKIKGRQIRDLITVHLESEYKLEGIETY